MSNSCDDTELTKQEHESNTILPKLLKAGLLVLCILLLFITAIPPYLTACQIIKLANIVGFFEFWAGLVSELTDIEVWIFVLTALSVVACAFLAIMIHRHDSILPEKIEKMFARAEKEAIDKLRKDSRLGLLLKYVLFLVPLLTLLYSFILASDAIDPIPFYYGIILFVTASYLALARKHITSRSPYRDQYDRLDNAVVHEQQLCVESELYLKESLSQLSTLLNKLSPHFAQSEGSADLWKDQSTVRNRMLVEFLKRLRQIQFRFVARDGDFIATKIYGEESLRVVRNMLDQIGLRISHENLTDSGWYAEDSQIGDRIPRQINWRRLLKSIEEIQRGFLELHDEISSKEELFTGIFQQLFDEEKDKLTRSVIDLATKGKSVAVPQFIAPVVMKRLMEREQVVSICILPPISSIS